jgi:hypothetical protein
MKFLKQKNISKFSIRDQTLFTNHFGRAVMGLTGGLRLPQGTTAQRPDETLVRYPGGTHAGLSSAKYADGTIRYNLDTNSLEALILGVWEVVRAPGATAITKQTIGPVNGTDTTFNLNQTPASADNIIVLVENVMQISVTNYTLITSNTQIQFTGPVPIGKIVTIYFGFAN